MTYLISYGTGEFLPGDTDRPTWTDSTDNAYCCDAYCCEDTLTVVAEHHRHGDTGLAGVRWSDATDDGKVSMVSFGLLPTMPEIDYIVACEGCGAVLNATEVESFDTGRRTVESGLAEVIGWAIARGYDPPSEDRWFADHHEDLDHGDQWQGLQWAFEKAEEYLGGLDGYYFDQCADTGTTTLWSRDASDPALVPSGD